ncbi:DUF3570 domain-containing protein [Methyloglobulus sp.]|uniref:DUF3570 domain-containing protein n=1 Tax=Methyloglobulus sp. TaxID=2518622 RepID=UPI0032B78917
MASPPSLKALTAAALILPGLFQPAAHAADEDSVDFQYSHYQEGKRSVYSFDNTTDPLTGEGIPSNIIKQPNHVNPIEVDSIHGSSRFSLTDRVKFAFNYTQDTWSGATPLGTAPAALRANGAIVTGASPFAKDTAQFFLDSKGNAYTAIDSLREKLSGIKSNQLTHVMSYASPETRKQGDFKLSYDWDEAAVDIGGGISVENDYESRFVNLGGRMDFNQKQTTVNVGLSYTNSDTSAAIDPDGLMFISTRGYDELITDVNSGAITYKPTDGAPAQIDRAFDNKGILTGAVLRGKRQDWGTQLGLTQVLNKDAVLELGMGYTRSTGYLANPYKLVYFIENIEQPGLDPSKPLLSVGGGRLEKRPEERNQFNWNLGYNQYLASFDAALHFDYHFTHDDWGINAHTLEADWVQPLGAGWTVTPRVRYYSQSSADFYTPDVRSITTGNDPITGEKIYSKPLPKNYSSDQRLSGFGALSGGVTVAKQFAKGVSLETGFEYYTHQGSLELGGGGEQAFADYDYWVANAALKINLAALGSGGSGHGGHSDHVPHHHGNSPSGVMFDHTLNKSGDFMVGYRFMRSEQAGDMLSGSQAVSPDTVRFNGCGDQECAVSPDNMTMNMHMLDLMVAPTDWLTLMVMPQWMDMEMTMTPLKEFVSEGGHNHAAGVSHNHQTGGVGDTGVYALFKLFGRPNHHITLSLGGTAPTGDVGIKLRKTGSVTGHLSNIPLHYGMQLGSGTWDFKPSLTYTGEMDRFSWGGQVTGTKRLESRNASNFAFGDIFQGSVWGGYQWTNWLATTVRGVYTTQGAIRGAYPAPTEIQSLTGLPFVQTHVGPFDKSVNYGGQFVDLGLGINVTIPNGAFAGNTLKFEWLQPLHTDYNGYQLDRDYSLAFTWGYGF